MKKILYISLAFILMLFTLSCTDYLDVNSDPSNPDNISAAVSNRLPWIQHYYLYGQVTAGARSSFVTQQLSFVNRIGRDGRTAGWNPVHGMVTIPYQFWFIGSACNLADLENAAEKEEAWHYIGAAKAIHALGFMMMVDWYGEMPYTEALGLTVTPKFDDGKTIFEGCLQKIDEAIEFLNKPQPPTATPLSAGDSWNGGNVDKWIKMCYGLKARWLNNLSKKAGLYNPDAILDAVSKGPISNSDNTVVKHEDVTETDKDILFGDPLKTSITFCCLGMNANSRVSKWYVDLLENFDDKGIEDPRANALLPWAQHSQGGSMFRTKGVDMQSDIRINNGPFPTTYNPKDTVEKTDAGGIPPHSWYCKTADTARHGDTVYISLRSGAVGYYGNDDMMYRAEDGHILSTTSFYIRPDAPTHFLCYHEMCFIKAEVLFKQGNNVAAFDAYKNGIRAHMELMNEKLSQYSGALYPGMETIPQGDIDNYLNTAIGTAADLTLSKIMTQKFIAMSFTVQNWNDMRRYDYSTEAYAAWAIPYEYSQTSAAQVSIPVGKQFRRVKQVSHEINYNSVNWIESHPNAAAPDIWSFPVWWDIVE